MQFYCNSTVCLHADAGAAAAAALYIYSPLVFWLAAAAAVAGQMQC